MESLPSVIFTRLFLPIISKSLIFNITYNNVNKVNYLLNCPGPYLQVPHIFSNCRRIILSISILFINSINVDRVIICHWWAVNLCTILLSLHVSQGSFSIHAPNHVSMHKHYLFPIFPCGHLKKNLLSILPSNRSSSPARPATLRNSHSRYCELSKLRPLEPS